MPTLRTLITAIITARSGQQTPVPRAVGKIRRTGPVELRDMEFLRKNTDRAAKITLPGPFTMSQQAKNEFYKDDEELAMAFQDLDIPMAQTPEQARRALDVAEDERHRPSRQRTPLWDGRNVPLSWVRVGSVTGACGCSGISLTDRSDEGPPPSSVLSEQLLPGDFPFVQQ